MARCPVIVHREGPGRRTPPSARPSSVPELSRLLRQTRAARGLPLDEASRQSGVALERLEDLESGTVDRLPDRVEILRDLSRYASFLGLPADQLVLSLVEAWPAGQSAAATAPVPTGASVTGTGAATAPVPTVAPQTTAIALTAARPRPPTPPSTIVVSDRHGSTAQVPVVMADTGRTPAVRASSDDGVAMALVRGLVVVLLVLLVVGTAWLVVDRVRPQWLADLPRRAGLQHRARRARPDHPHLDQPGQSSGAAPGHRAALDAPGLGDHQSGHLRGDELALRGPDQRTRWRDLGAGDRPAAQRAELRGHPAQWPVPGGAGRPCARRPHRVGGGPDRRQGQGAAPRDLRPPRSPLRHDLHLSVGRPAQSWSATSATDATTWPSSRFMIRTPVASRP